MSIPARAERLRAARARLESGSLPPYACLVRQSDETKGIFHSLSAPPAWDPRKIWAAAELINRQLVEISVLAGVFGLLFLIVYPSFSGLFRKSAEGQIKGDLAQLRGAVEAYRRRKGDFPESLEALVQAGLLEEMPPLWPRFSGVPHEPLIRRLSGLKADPTCRALLWRVHETTNSVENTGDLGVMADNMAFQFLELYR